MTQTLSVLEAIQGRRAVRAYSDERVGEKAIRTLIDAAVRAPTAVHLEPWAFAVIQDPALLRRISDQAKALWPKSPPSPQPEANSPAMHAYADMMADPAFNIFYDASTLIVICARPLGSFVVADCWLAAENVMLAACGMGLATCVIGSAVPALNAADIRAALDLPAAVLPVAPIIVGYPRSETPATPRKPPEILSWVK